MRNLERWTVGTLMAVALLTFFFPLVTIHLPIVGNQDLSGYEVLAEPKSFSHSLSKLTSTTPGGHDSELTKSAPTSSNAAATNLPMPFSVRTLIIIPVEIIISFICVLVTLLCCFPIFVLVRQTGRNCWRGSFGKRRSPSHHCKLRLA